MIVTNFVFKNIFVGSLIRFKIVILHVHVKKPFNLKFTDSNSLNLCPKKSEGQLSPHPVLRRERFPQSVPARSDLGRAHESQCPPEVEAQREGQGLLVVHRRVLQAGGRGDCAGPLLGGAPRCRIVQLLRQFRESGHPEEAAHRQE